MKELLFKVKISVPDDSDGFSEYRAIAVAIFDLKFKVAEVLPIVQFPPCKHGVTVKDFCEKCWEDGVHQGSSGDKN